MPSILDRLRFGDVEFSGHMSVPADRVLRDGRVFQPEVDILAGEHYFSVTVNSFALAHAREYAKTYMPMLVASTQMRYDGHTRDLPFVIGPSLAGLGASEAPASIALRDTRVAGPHPYYGDLAVSVVLYRIQQDDAARRLLSVVEQASRALAPAGAVLPFLEVGKVVLDGVDTLMGYAEKEALLVSRVDFPRDGLRQATHAITSEAMAPADVSVRQGRLHVGDGPVRGVDSVIYTVARHEAIDLATLPWFPPMWQRIVRYASRANDDDKGIAKAFLLELNETLATSPDIARGNAESLYRDWEGRARSVHQRAKATSAWGPGDDASRARRERLREIREASW